MEKPKLIRFGTIFDSGGQLYYEDFIIDGVGTDLLLPELVLILAIERLQAELLDLRIDEARGRKPITEIK